MRRKEVVACLTCAFLLLSCCSATATSVLRTSERLPSDRPEVWAMNYFTSLALLTGFGTPPRRKFLSIEPAAELDWVPAVSDEDARVGFNGVKEEDLNKAPIFARPRLTIGLPLDFALTLSYVPPVKLFGVRANLFAFGFERPIWEHRSWSVGLRAYGQIGHIDGAFTCPSGASRYKPGSSRNPAGCQNESDDTAYQNYGGLEASIAYRIDQLKKLTPYLTVSGNYLSTAFQVRALTNGFEDRTYQSASTWTFAMSAGVVYPLTDKIQVAVGMFYSPLQVTRPPATSSSNDGVVNVRSMLTYRWR